MDVFITEDFQNSWIFQDEKKIKWWIDLHFLANEDGIINLSLADLSRRWRTDRATVSRFLSRLSEKPLCNTLVQHFVQQITISRTTSYKGTCNTSCNTLVQQQKESPLSSPSLSSPTPPSITPPIIPQENPSSSACMREENFALKAGVIATLEEYARKYRKEINWDDLAIQNHLKRGQPQQIFEDFMFDQKHNETDHDDYSDFKRHFLNYIRKRAQAFRVEQQSQVSEKKVISGSDIFNLYK